MNTYQHYKSENEKLKTRNAWLEACLTAALEELVKVFDYDKVLAQSETEIELEVEARR